MALEGSPATAAISGCGFPRAVRLLDGHAYSQVFANSIRVGNQHWTVLVHAGGGASSRLGLAIAKKRARRAVDRNLLKRVVRESFRVQRESLHGLDIVVMNRDKAAAAGRAELRRSIDQLWSRLQRCDQQGTV